MTNIHFEKATLSHKDLIFEWLEEPHMKEFWDNSQEHKDDILNFMNGQKQHYFYGTTTYWVGFLDDQSFCFLLTDELLADQDDLTDLLRAYLSKTGKTISLDFGIGNKIFLGKGLAAPTLQKFVEFYNARIDPQADTFFIDPNENNPRAKHVYEKAGFKVVDKYIAKKGYFIGDESLLMIKKIDSLKNAFKFVPLSTQPSELSELVKLAIGSPTLEKVQKILESYDEPNHHLLGCYNEDKLVGVIGLQVDGNHGIIKHIAVLETYQKRRIGKALIREAITYLKIKTCEAETDEEGKGFYEKCDFTITPFKGPYCQRFKCILKVTTNPH